MGKPSSSGGKLADDAVSLHTNPGESSMTNYNDLDEFDAPEISVDDLPPNYTETAENESLLPPPGEPMPIPAASGSARVSQPFVEDATLLNDVNTGAQFWVSKSLENPDALEKHNGQDNRDTT